MSENQNNDSKNLNTPYIIIIILLIIIAALAFFVGKGFNQSNNGNSNTPVAAEVKDIKITVIGDKRCNDCQTEAVTENLKTLPFLTGATFEVKDFSDSGVEDLMKKNSITKLPAFLFNTDNVPDADFKKYLEVTPAFMYNLNMGATFDPYAKMSERGFTIVPDGILAEIKKNSRILGKEDAEILWVEYSDMNCTYCKKMHNEGTHAALFDKYKDKLSLAYQYFAIFNKEAPLALECIADQKGTEEMYQVITKGYKEEKATPNDLAGFVEKLDKKAFDECVASKKYESKIDFAMKVGAETFGVTGTPGNILINQKTGEYAKLPGAYPVSEFEKVIDKLLTK
ncbi:thioredoxin domain-containing protein [Candidatus Gracilibacteria bacterium]|nr:thioredoxin domain-containing protein [Candidatus Gracilibacteria bacterium]